MKSFILTFFCLLISSSVMYSQSLGGFPIADYLVSAIHPNGCVDNHVTGPPDDSTWVNMNNGDIMTGNFGFSWIDVAGDDLLLETSYHTDNYDVRLQLSSGGFSTIHSVLVSDWIQIIDTPWVHLFYACNNSMSGVSRYILPLDFNVDFGLGITDTVVGIEITFLTTSGAPDLAGAYIIGVSCNTTNLGNDLNLCQGDTFLLNATASNASYLWQDNSTNSTFLVSQPGTYWVQVTDSCGTTIDTISINYNPLPNVNLGSDTVLCPGEILFLNVTIPNSTYLWQDNSINPVISISQPGTYWVQVTNNCGSATDTISIEVETCEINLVMPNILTPNNDGLNDVFIPLVMEGINQATIVIYNRWGQLLYESSNIMIGWKGDCPDGNCSDGTYYWIIQYIDRNNNPLNIKGFITLLR